MAQGANEFVTIYNPWSGWAKVECAFGLLRLGGL